MALKGTIISARWCIRFVAHITHYTIYNKISGCDFLLTDIDLKEHVCVCESDKDIIQSVIAQQSSRMTLCKAKRHPIARSLLTQYKAVKSSLKIPKMLCISLRTCVCETIIKKKSYRIYEFIWTKRMLAFLEPDLLFSKCLYPVLFLTWHSHPVNKTFHHSCKRLSIPNICVLEFRVRNMPSQFKKAAQSQVSSSSCRSRFTYVWSLSLNWG